MEGSAGRVKRPTLLNVVPYAFNLRLGGFARRFLTLDPALQDSDVLALLLDELLRQFRDLRSFVWPPTVR